MVEEKKGDFENKWSQGKREWADTVRKKMIQERDLIDWGLCGLEFSLEC